jgi:hypothetical protein
MLRHFPLIGKSTNSAARRGARGGGRWGRFDRVGNSHLAPMSADRVVLVLRNRGKSRGGTIIRFPGRHESDSFWEWCRLQTLMIFRWAI